MSSGNRRPTRAGSTPASPSPKPSSPAYDVLTVGGIDLRLVLAALKVEEPHRRAAFAAMAHVLRAADLLRTVPATDRFAGDRTGVELVNRLDDVIATLQADLLNESFGALVGVGEDDFAAIEAVKEGGAA